MKDLSVMIEEAVRTWVSKGREDYLRECRSLLADDPEGMGYAAAIERVTSWIYGDFKAEMRTQGPRSPLMAELLEAVWEHLDVDAIATEIVDETIAKARAELAAEDCGL